MSYFKIFYSYKEYDVNNIKFKIDGIEKWNVKIMEIILTRYNPISIKSL